jgi:hypothetical protein
MQSIKKLIIGLSLLFGLATVSLAGQYGQATLVTGAQDPSQLNATINGVIIQQNAIAPGLLYSNTTVVPTGTGTSEQTLGTYDLPASYLTRSGQSIRIKATFSYAANTNNRTPKIYFGATVTKTGTLNATSGGSGALECIVTRSGTSTQVDTCVGLDGITNVVQTFLAGTEAETAAINIKATCTDGTSSASDCVLNNFIVESLR